MRILHSVYTFLPVSENWIYPQVFRVPGVEAAVLCHERQNDSLFPGQPIWTDTPAWSRWLGIPRVINSIYFRLGHPMQCVKSRVQRWHPNLIHAHFGPQGADLVPLSRELNIPLVTSFYGSDAWARIQVQPAIAGKYRELFEHGKCFLVEGPAMQARLVELGCSSKKIQVVRIGVSLSAPSPLRPFSSPPRILMVGRFCEKKGFIDGLQACAQAAERGASFSVTIVGDSPPQDASGMAIKNSLLALAKTPSLQGRITFTGFVPPEKIQVLLESHDLFLCPSKHAVNGDAEGGSPVILTQAMGNGLLCIGTRHCDIPELIEDRGTGYLVPSGDVDALAHAIGESLHSSQADSWRLAGRQRVHSLFSQTRQLDELASLYLRAATS